MRLKGIFTLAYFLFGLGVFSQSDTSTVPVLEVDLPDAPESRKPKEPEHETTEIFDQTLVEIKPEFPGGIQEFYNFLGDNMVYPEEAKNKGHQGKVYISFVIDEFGCVTKPQVIKGNYHLLNNEAIRVLMSMPDWTPGEHLGKSVKIRCAIPIYFHIDDIQLSKKEIRKSKRKK